MNLQITNVKLHTHGRWIAACFNLCERHLLIMILELDKKIEVPQFKLFRVDVGESRWWRGRGHCFVLKLRVIQSFTRRRVSTRATAILCIAQPRTNLIGLCVCMYTCACVSGVPVCVHACARACLCLLVCVWWASVCMHACACVCVCVYCGVCVVCLCVCVCVCVVCLCMCVVVCVCVWCDCVCIVCLCVCVWCACVCVCVHVCVCMCVSESRKTLKIQLLSTVMVVWEGFRE